MSLPTKFSGSGVPGMTAYEGATFQREDAGNGELYIAHGAAWVRLLRSNEGVAGLVTLAGDVTGPASANTVVGLTGSTGVTAVHMAGLFWDAAVTGATIKQVAAVSGAGGNFSIIAQNGALGSNGGALILSSGAGFVHGNIAFDLGGGLVASFDASINSFLLAMPSVLFNAVQTSPTIKQVDAAGGAGQPLNIIAQKGGSNSNGGPLFFATGAGQGSGVAGPVVFQLGTTIFAELTVADNGLLMLAPNITFGPSVAAPTISQTAVTGINAQHMTIAAQGVSGLGGLAANLRLMGGNDTASGQLGGYVEVYGGDGSGGQAGGYRQFFGRTTPVLAQRALLVPGTANHFEWYQVDGTTLLADLTDTTGFSLHTVAAVPAGVAGMARIFSPASATFTGAAGGLAVVNPAGQIFALAPGGTAFPGALRLNSEFKICVQEQTFGASTAAMGFDLATLGDGVYLFSFEVVGHVTSDGSNDSGFIFQKAMYRRNGGNAVGIATPAAIVSGGAGVGGTTLVGSIAGSTVFWTITPTGGETRNIDWSITCILQRHTVT